MTIIPAFLVMSMACIAVAVHADGKSTAPAKSDSLKTLEVIISSEIKPGNRVFSLESRSLADSLMRGNGGTHRDWYDSLARTGVAAKEINDQEEFRKYWGKMEEQSGVSALKRQYESVDIDKSRIPKKYLFDSSVVIYPGWLILRKR